MEINFPKSSPGSPSGLPRGRSLEIVKFKQLDGAPAPSSCLNLTISSSLKFPKGAPGQYPAPPDIRPINLIIV